MAEINTLQMIKMIPTFDRSDFVEWTRSFNDILQISWPFLSKIVHERPKPISGEIREGEENNSDFNYNDSSSNEVSADGSRNSNSSDNYLVLYG